MDTPYLPFAGELWGVYCEYLEKIDHVNGTILYIFMRFHVIHFSISLGSLRWNWAGATVSYWGNDITAPMLVK